MIQYQFTKEGYIKIPITQQILQRAKQREFKADKRTYLEANRDIGFIGEEIYQTIFHDATLMKGYEYDFNWKDFRIEIKTKKRKVYPRDSYEATIPEYTMDKEICDIFVFFSFVNRTDAYLLGWITHEDFIRKSIFRPKGFRDTNGVVYKEGTYDLKILHLERFNSFLTCCAFGFDKGEYELE